MERNRPYWLDRKPSEWPASARIVYSIFLEAAEQALAEKQGGSPQTRPDRVA